ncbi:MAG: hypothetical protein K0S08_1029 [Gammaproteobacteria bacterium]|jgi:hypothetical protein|nr:hypothetical protein [Gammaproteobacteria bacterium]
MDNPTVSKVLAELYQCDLSCAETTSLKTQIKTLLDCHAHCGVLLPTNFVKFYRARKFVEKPTKLEELSYPPIEQALLGRANLPGRQVLYCSASPSATFFELNTKPGDFVAISTWTLNDHALIFPIGYDKAALEQLGFNKDCQEILISSSNSIKPQPEIIRFLENAFTQDITEAEEYKYKLSAAIAEYFYQIQPCCGLVYPTTAMQAEAKNFALNYELVNKQLTLESVIWYRVDEGDDSHYKVSKLACAEAFSNGVIQWRPPRTDETIHMQFTDGSRHSD